MTKLKKEKKTEVTTKTEPAIQIGDLKKEIVKLRFEKEMGKLKNIRSIYNIRKQIARLLTLQKEKENHGNN